MAKKSTATQKFAGQSFAVTGKLENWQSKALGQFLTMFGGKLIKSIDKKLTYLVVGTSRSKKASAEELKVQDLNKNHGASIQIIDQDTFQKLARLTPDEFIGLARAGGAGAKALKYVSDLFQNLIPELENVDLRGARIDGVHPLALKGVDLSGATLRDCDISLENCKLDGAVLNDVSVERMTNCRAHGTDFCKAELYSFEANGCDMTEADFSKAECDINAKGLTAPRSNWTGAGADSSRLENGDLTGAILAKSEWVNSIFIDMNLTGADCQEANLNETKFTRCDLTGANLRDAQLIDATFEECTLDKADFTGAKLAGLKLEKSDTSKAIGFDAEAASTIIAAGPHLLELEKIAKKCGSMQTTIGLRKGRKEETEYVYWTKGHNTESVSDMMLSRARHFPGATFTADTIKLYARNLPIPRKEALQIAIAAWHEAFGLEPPSEAAVKELKQAGKSKKAAFSEKMIATLRGKDGVKQWNKKEGHFHANGVTLNKVDLAGCNLKGIVLQYLDCKEANLQGANLEKVDAWSAKLGNANLKEAKAKGGHFSGASMIGADLSDADFTRADFNRANLKNAICKGTDFTGADLAESDLCGADLTGAKFDKAKLHGAKFDETTKFPKNFPPTKEMKWQGKGQSPAFKAAAPPKPKGPLDTAAFMTRLAEHSEAAKLQKALSMLKADRFKLYAPVTDDHLVGIVKSQSDPDLVYSCKLASDGVYGCCTQNLNICGGLRGSLCKHLLVLIVGLTKGGDLEPGKVDDWVMSSQGQKPAIDKDAMSETFLRYKGAEAGEIDWRPTETIPEDYYAM